MNNQDSKIHFILTGGTIDSKWKATMDTITPNEHSVIPEYIGGLKLYKDFDFTEVCMKDSRSLTPEDVTVILNTIENSPNTKIIITHGTYTMPDTARFLKANLKRKNQTIILTGSMAPLKGFDASDAPFSLGFAYSKVQELPAGVYLCMNGAIFSPEEAAKNISEGKFYSVFQNL
jgi:L-asparaginase